MAYVGEGFELQGVAGWIEEEHGRLLADLATKADMGFDDEVDAGGAETVGEVLPVLHGKDNTKVRDGDVVSIDGIVVGVAAAVGGLEVRDDLVAEEIEVDPLGGAAALGTVQYGAVEGAGGFEVVDGKGDVKRGEGWHESLLESMIARWRVGELLPMNILNGSPVECLA